MSTYSFADVSANIAGTGGVFSLSEGGVAEEGIDIAMAGDKNTMTVGADGDGMHSLHAAKSGTVTVRLLKTNPLNAKLMVLYDAQELVSTAWGSNLITVSNTTVGDITTARNCAFKKKPNIKYAKEGDILEWAFDVIKIDTILGTYS